jgi:AAA domain
MTDAERRWNEIEAAARAGGIDPVELTRLILRPLPHGAGWKYWQPWKTTEELAGWLTRRLVELIREKEKQVALSLARTNTVGRNKPDRIILYGPPGWGKTSFAAYMPKAVFIMTPGEDRLLKLIEQGLVPPTGYFEDIAQSWPDVTGAVQQLIDQPHDYQTLVVDTGNGVERLAHEEVCYGEFGGDWGEKGFASFGTGEKITANRLWSPFLALLDELRSKRRMRIVLCCHAGVRTVRNPEGADYEKIEPSLSKQGWGMTAKWADMILCGSFDIQVKKESKIGKGKAQGTYARLLHTQASPAYEAKNCHRLPATINLGKDALKAFAAFRAAFPARPQPAAPDTATNGSSEKADVQPEAKSPFLLALERKDEEMTARSLIVAGELISHVQAAVVSLKLAESLTALDPRHYPQVETLIATFEEECRRQPSLEEAVS